MTMSIVAGVDTSQTALTAAQKAASLADKYGAELHIVSAYSTTTADTVWPTKGRKAPVKKSDAYEQLTDGKARAAQEIAEAVAAVLREAYPNLKVDSSAVEGLPADVLLRKSKELRADTIVVGNKNIQGLKRILGSVARKVSTEATCDVFIVNTTQK